MTTAVMRLLQGTELRPLGIVPLASDDVVCVDVPMFGHLIVAKDRTRDNAILTKGPGQERLVHVHHADNGDFEIEMLPDHPGGAHPHPGDRVPGELAGERLVVVISE